VVADLEQTFRERWGYVLAALIGFLGDFDLAEEAAQEAFAVAAERSSSPAATRRSPPMRRSRSPCGRWAA
jgi:predicted RNA polymerase sigma factor